MAACRAAQVTEREGTSDGRTSVGVNSVDGREDTGGQPGSAGMIMS